MKIRIAGVLDMNSEMDEFLKYVGMSELDLIREKIRLGDKFPYEEAERTLGYNALMQITKVEPDFFSGDYAIIRMVPKKRQRRQFMTQLEPLVVFTTSDERIKTGSVFRLQKGLSGIVRSGVNVTVSPVKKRKFSTDSYTLVNTGPLDNLAIGEVYPAAGDGIGEPRVFYNNTPSEIPLRLYGNLRPFDFTRGLTEYGIHFAFVREDAGNPRKRVYLERDWSLGP